MKRIYGMKNMSFYDGNFEFRNYARINMSVLPFNSMFSNLIALPFT
jgi:hypothetical protein